MKLHNIKYYLVTIYAIIVSLAFNLLNLEKEATVSLVFLALSSLLLYKYLYKSKEPLPEMTTNKQVINMNLQGDEKFTNSLVIGMHIDRKELLKKIKNRLIGRIKIGMIDEVEKLLNNGVSAQRLYSLGLEYRFISDYLTGTPIENVAIFFILANIFNTN